MVTITKSNLTTKDRCARLLSCALSVPSLLPAFGPKIRADQSIRYMEVNGFE
jgi:hypothetical protein